MNLKAYDCWASHPQTTSQCYITHICPWFCTTPEDHAAKVPVWCRSSAAITKPKLCSRASRYVLVGDKVCVSAVMIQGGLGLWVFFLSSQPIRALRETHLPLQEAGRSLLLLVGSSFEAVEMAVNFVCSFATLCCLALWSFTRPSGGKSGK